jgi:hypothetical protein
LIEYIFIINITFIISKQYEGGHRSERNSEVGHEQNKVEKHCFRPSHPPADTNVVEHEQELAAYVQKSISVFEIELILKLLL